MDNLTPAASLDQLALLALAWGLWGAGHSLLLRQDVTARLLALSRLPPASYRLYYSMAALASILPPLAYCAWLGGLRVYWWPWPWRAAQVLLAGGALGLAVWAEWAMMRAGVDLLGLGQARGRQPAPQALVRGGPYARLRHPMYLASLLLLWARALAPADLVTSLALTLYLVLGTWHEESTLRRQMGQAYRDYARRVPLIPGLPGRVPPAGPKRVD
ncbi:MAG: methyltransferase [Pseudomonadota bacterium]